MVYPSLADTYERDQLEIENRRLKEDIKDLRSQMSKSASMVGEYSDLKKQLDHSEKQKRQLSDHIQVTFFSYSYLYTLNSD